MRGLHAHVSLTSANMHQQGALRQTDLNDKQYDM